MPIPGGQSGKLVHNTSKKKPCHIILKVKAQMHIPVSMATTAG